jgi:hypothetical protein
VIWLKHTNQCLALSGGELASFCRKRCSRLRRISRRQHPTSASSFAAGWALLRLACEWLASATSVENLTITSKALRSRCQVEVARQAGRFCLG